MENFNESQEESSIIFKKNVEANKKPVSYHGYGFKKEVFRLL